MNERIQELIRQATHVVEPNDPDYRHEIFNKELFARLIVLECAETVKNSIWHLPRGYKAEDQAEFVKKHFGVEE